MDKMRREFEAWCLRNHYPIAPAETNCNILIEGSYRHHKVQLAWEAWQESRLALCVKLPSEWDEPFTLCDVMDARDVMDTIRDAIRDAGVSCK